MAKESVMKKEDPKYIDLLDEDLPIAGQKFACLSFVSPENILKQKDLYYFNQFLKQYDFNKSLEKFTQFLNFVAYKYKVDFDKLTKDLKEFSDEEKVIIEVEFKKDKEFYHLCYKDNGPGIDEKYWKKIFLMFETLENANNENTGIGLATVESIIKRLGGEIYLKNRDDGKKGVSFHFHFSKRELLH